jgi:hemin uptake protein HemP
MNLQPPSEPTKSRFDIPRPPRQRVSTIDLMRGSRELILRITKAGKLILTK